jgi:hypothetical protein
MRPRRLSMAVPPKRAALIFGTYLLGRYANVRIIVNSRIFIFSKSTMSSVCVNDNNSSFVITNMRRPYCNAVAISEYASVSVPGVPVIPLAATKIPSRHARVCSKWEKFTISLAGTGLAQFLHSTKNGVSM